MFLEVYQCMFLQFSLHHHHHQSSQKTCMLHPQLRPLGMVTVWMPVLLLYVVAYNPANCHSHQREVHLVGLVVPGNSDLLFSAGREKKKNQLLQLLQGCKDNSSELTMNFSL